MSPAEFFQSYGLVVDQPRDDARWHRVPTVDHPKKKNGAYLLDGTKAVCQNWATMLVPEVMKPDATVRPITQADRDAAAKRRREREETQEVQWKRAAGRAAALKLLCRPGTHGYAMRKGFPMAQVLVTPDAEMLVPMRNVATDELVGAQIIRWLIDERRWEKKFLPGMRAKGAVFRLGPRGAKETVLCEGWATGWSLMDAANQVKLSMGVLVCFSAGNIVEVSKHVKGRAFVFADNDPVETDPDKIAKGNLGEAGRYAAEKTGLPWTMAPEVGMDANDWHQKHGLRSLAGMLLDLRRKKA